MLSSYAKRSSGDNFETSANITAGTNLSGGNVSSDYDVSAGGFLFGKSGCGDTHAPAVMSRTTNKISLYWNGSGCYIFIDKVMIGKIVTS